MLINNFTVYETGLVVIPTSTALQDEEQQLRYYANPKLATSREPLQ